MGILIEMEMEILFLQHLILFPLAYVLLDESVLHSWFPKRFVPSGGLNSLLVFALCRVHFFFHYATTTCLA